MTPHDGCRVSPFGHPRIKACLAAPRGLSQLTTSFIGSRRQGIHRWLFVAWKNKDARARYAILKGRRPERLPCAGLWGTQGWRPEGRQCLTSEVRDKAPTAGETGFGALRGTPWKQKRERTATTMRPRGDP